MLFGSYIRDYEQLGVDRALCRQRFDANPSIRKSLISELGADTRTSVLRLCFHHLVELLALENPLKRAFYEIEYIPGNWSVRTIKRPSQKLGIRDSYIFEFFGLKASDAVSESDLETAHWTICMILSKSIHLPLYPTTGGGICNS